MPYWRGHTQGNRPLTDLHLAPRRGPHKHAETVASSLRFALKTLTALNSKTPTAEKHGYLQSILYLAPHTVAGGATVCPHSTAACRAGCLYSAGRGAFDNVRAARVRRTLAYLNDRPRFLADLVRELRLMEDVARQNGLKLAVRLNGTSDVLWERERLADGRSLFETFSEATFFDYTRTPAQHRRVPANWHLTFSLADDPLEHAIEHLQAGRSVAAVVPEHLQERLVGDVGHIWLGAVKAHYVDGAAHDLRFLDPRPAIVLLKPKGALRRGGPMVRERLGIDLMLAARSMQP